MQRNMTFVRNRFPRAEASVKGGTRELVALNEAGTADERWVIFSDNGPDAEMLGEGSSIQTAWEDAAANVLSSESGTGEQKPPTGGSC
jgi:hypothetical protein